MNLDFFGKERRTPDPQSDALAADSEDGRRAASRRAERIQARFDDALLGGEPLQGSASIPPGREFGDTGRAPVVEIRPGDI